MKKNIKAAYRAMTHAQKERLIHLQREAITKLEKTNDMQRDYIRKLETEKYTKIAKSILISEEIITEVNERYTALDAVNEAERILKEL